MSIYFAFSDECGDYKRNPGEKFLASHPYYLRATFIIKAKDWKDLRRKTVDKKRTFELPRKKEIKWSYIWSLKSSQDRGHEVSKDKDWYFLRNHDWQNLLNYVEKVLKLLKQELDYCKVVITVTPNDGTNIYPSNLHKMHIQDTIQRVQYEIQERDGELCVPFFDSVNKTKNDTLREAYNKIYQEPDFVNRYDLLIDSLNLQYSHHSVGIEIADYIAGCFKSLLRNQGTGSRLLRNYIKPIMRSGPGNKLAGWGFILIPSGQEKEQNEIARKLKGKNSKT